MGDSKKKDNDIFDIITKIGKIAFIVFICIAILVLIIFSALDKKPLSTGDVYRYIDHWTVTEQDGTTFETGRSYYSDRDFKSSFTITTTLPDDIDDNSYILFTTGKDIKVYANGELRAKFNEAEDVHIPGGVVKRFYIMAPLKASDSGKELRMERVGTTRKGNIVPETIITTKEGVYSFMIMKYGISFILSIFLFVFSSVVVIVSLVMRFMFKERIPMFYGALGVLVLAGWLVTDSFLYPLVFGHYHIDGVVNYMLCLLAPFGVTLYMNFLQKGRNKKIMGTIIGISTVSFIFWTSMHFLSIISFPIALPYMNTVLGIEILFVIVVLVLDIKKGYASEYKYTAMGFVCFLLCCILEICLILFVPSNQESIPMIVGLAFILTAAVIQQIVDLKKANEERQRAIDLSESKTRFLASMSHEIRTPINSILGMNEMILRENRDDVIGGYARNIKSSGKMLLMLVNDVLDFSKIEAGKLEIVDVKYRLSDVLRGVNAICYDRAVDKGLSFKIRLLNEVPDGQVGDEFRIRQILVNLVNNAIKYTDEGKITLVVFGEHMEDGRFKLGLNVRDTGKGIKRQDKDHLFEAFQRVDVKNNIHIEGTGLGLAIVKSIVDSMEGEIEVESEYGKGSEFIVQIPVGISDETPIEDDFIKKESVNETETDECDFYAPDARVLAVDDNQSNLTIVRLFLKRTGIDPVLCDSGAEAIRRCKCEEYDIILLDHMMPTPDGIETLYHIRNDEDSLNKNTVAIVLTANAVAGSRQIYIDAGFEDYLTKPLDYKILEDTVKKYLPAEVVKEINEPEGKMENESMHDGKNLSVREKLESIEGLDYETALKYSAGDEEILEEVLSDIVAESDERIDRLKKNLAEGDLDGYETDVHAIKGLMATIGYSALSERAKNHEYAAKENNKEFIDGDFEDFIKEYEDLIQRIK